MGIVGLAQAVDVIKCGAEIGLDHLYNPAGGRESRSFARSAPNLRPPRRA
jgi:hypothetical protein